MSEHSENLESGGEMYDHPLRVAVFDLRNNILLSPTPDFPSTFLYVKRHNRPVPGEPWENLARRVGTLLPEYRIGVSKFLGKISLDFAGKEGFTPAYAVSGSAQKSDVLHHFSFKKAHELLLEKNDLLTPETTDREAYINTRLLLYGFSEFVANPKESHANEAGESTS